MYGVGLPKPTSTATANNDGLMSKEDKQLLQTIKDKLGL